MGFNSGFKGLIKKQSINMEANPVFPTASGNKFVKYAVKTTTVEAFLSISYTSPNLINN